MKKNIVLKLLFIVFFQLTSQEQITNFIIGSSQTLINDTEKLVEGYMSPVGKWFGSGLNAGWYNTAKPHQFPGFDVTAGFHVITPNTNSQFFNPSSELTNLSTYNNGQLSTILGPSEETQILYTLPDTEINDEPLFNMPGGLDWGNSLLMPYIQGSIGLIKKTEILFRYAPTVNLKKFKSGFWGFGLKHDIKQWIPGVKILPFNLSILSAYSKLNSQYDFTGPEQNLTFDIKAFNSNLILSKKIAFITPYLGIGYQYSKSSLALNGNYTVLDWDGEQVIEGEELNITDPIDFSFGGVNGLKATIGARIKLLLFTIHVDWTKANYDVFTIGFGLNSDIGSRIIGGSI
ncbi:MAG: hypothetical protein CBD51_000090 [Flavobacteriales bacterium TMED191]|nr:MAG: hypothetical protein CBD51_000090 [Flavobacteriales bacterium TMED191]